VYFEEAAAAAGAAAAAVAAAAAGAAVVVAVPAAGAFLFTPPCPLQAPRPPFDEAPSLQVTMPVLALVLVLVLAAAAGAAAAGAAGVIVVLPPPVADLLTPPCPLHAPRPPLDEVPSLQVTVVALLVLVLVLAAAAGAAVVAAGAGALLPEVVLVAGADLLTPPCPLQAPRPPLDEVPSLQVTVGVVLEVSCAEQTTLPASTVAASAAAHVTAP
jgi:hypothetical protein